MKRLLLILVLCLSGVAIMKGEQLVATLQSGDDLKIFYGYSALKEACEVASDGDVITLSRGNFEKVSTEKSITLRGAGAFVTGESTVIEYFGIKANNVVIEGVDFPNTLDITGKKIQILRCNIGRLAPYSSEEIIEDAFVSDCAIYSHEIGGINSIYRNCAIGYSWGEYFATFDNCVITAGQEIWSTPMCQYGSFFNCIIKIDNDDVNKCLDIYAPNQFYDSIIYYTGPINLHPGLQWSNFVTAVISKEEYDKKFENFPYFFSEDISLPDLTHIVCGVVDHKDWPAIPRVIESNIAKETHDSGHLKVEVKVSCEK